MNVVLNESLVVLSEAKGWRVTKLVPPSVSYVLVSSAAVILPLMDHTLLSGSPCVLLAFLHSGAVLGTNSLKNNLRALAF